MSNPPPGTEPHPGEKDNPSCCHHEPGEGTAAPAAHDHAGHDHAAHDAAGHDCCAHDHHDHGHAAHGAPPALPATAKYFCPMCDGVVSDKPGACPKCGMALERNPAYVEPTATVYTCPMHPEIRQDTPARAPSAAWRWSRLWPAPARRRTTMRSCATCRAGSGSALCSRCRSFVLAMGEMVPGLRDLIAALGRTEVTWIQFVLTTPVVLWAGWPFLERARGRWSRVTSTCSR